MLLPPSGFVFAAPMKLGGHHDVFELLDEFVEANIRVATKAELVYPQIPDANVPRNPVVACSAFRHVHLRLLIDYLINNPLS